MTKLSAGALAPLLFESRSGWNENPAEVVPAAKNLNLTKHGLKRVKLTYDQPNRRRIASTGIAVTLEVATRSIRRMSTSVLDVGISN